MTDPTPTGPRRLWAAALIVAFSQLGVAGVAAGASARDILSDWACLGGIFGTLANIAVLGAVAVWLISLVARSVRAQALHPWIAPLFLVVLSSGVAMLIGGCAALRCTV